jgi:hypothetical protein
VAPNRFVGPLPRVNYSFPAFPYPCHLDLSALAKLLGGSAAGAAIVVTYLFASGIVVSGKIYRKMEERAEKAEARIYDMIPVLRRAGDAVVRSTDLARVVVEDAKNANGTESP